MKAVLQFWRVLVLQTRQAFYNRIALAAVAFTWMLRVVITIALYKGIYNAVGVESIRNTPFLVAVSSMVFYAVYSGFGARDLTRAIERDYKSGAMEMWLNKPVSYLVYKAAENLGNNVPIMLALLGVAVLFFCTGGLPAVDAVPERILAGVLVLLLGVTVGYMLYALVGLVVFWLHDSSAAYWMVDKTIMVFGGAYVPIAFFPDRFRLLGESLPTGAVTLLSQVFYPDFFDNLPRFIATQIFWIAALALALLKATQAANKNLSVNGG